MTRTAAPYIGRFAPSPTGPLHFGSLVAAMGSYLQARTCREGQWLLRIEDLDPPREQPGIADGIKRILEQFGFEWDGPASYQSEHSERYLEALQHLRDDDLLYACDCTRKQIIARARHTGSGYVYAGTCRHKSAAEFGRQKAWRVRVNAPCQITFKDLIQGTVTQDVAEDVGDFILRRRDGLWSYQLAVVVDDATQKITEVVRGRDLLDNTPRQIYLQKLLKLPTPDYAHLPLALNESGDKLSKQTFAPALDPKQKFSALYAAWHLLGQCPARPTRQTGNLVEFWEWATSKWDVSRIPNSH